MWCGSSRLVATISAVLIIALVEFVPYSKVPDENIPNYLGRPHRRGSNMGLGWAIL